MMHYQKGENIEEELSRERLPFADCMPLSSKQNFLWMHVKGGTKVANVINFAKNALDKGESRSVVWSGSGGGVVKTISCAEILKRSHPLYQVSRMCYTITEEHWIPKKDKLESIVVTRKIPCIHILMSLDSIDVTGVQLPNTKTDFWVEGNSSSTANSQPCVVNKQRQRRPREHPPSHEDRDQQQQQQKTNTPPHGKEGKKQKKNQYQRGQQQQKQSTDEQQATTGAAKQQPMNS